MSVLQQGQQLRVLPAGNAHCLRTRRIAPRLQKQRQLVRAVEGEPPAKQPAPKASKTAAAKKQPHNRVFNFSAGPAVLPLPVLEQAQKDLLNWNNSGMSVMEMSHRGKEFESILAEAEEDLRTLLSIPDDFEVLFLQGGATAQFTAICQNFLENDDHADYILTGAWSKKAYKEGERYAEAHIAAQGDGTDIPPEEDWDLTEGSQMVHICDNETIQGVEFKFTPDVGERLLVADMSSSFCSKPIDVDKYDLIYAGAQKNIGPAGVTVVIIHETLFDEVDGDEIAAPLHYKTYRGSLHNTPPTWSIYICGLVFKHLLKQGGIDAVYANNQAKADLLYNAIDGSSGFYDSPVDPAVRSNMNVPFTIPGKPELEKAFIAEAAKAGMVQLKGHRSVGGMRASIYNSMPMEGVQALVKFMADFQKKHS
mmetsp:Transcript_15382/g.46438  ORF Transcript_15382/g.46438 Transcript_15382/m.46438 type:complete len:422 (+) Transcript_15382:160-1425(+)|eukprot:CAMPEP_0206148710 /NCGR_PEP_ID=MMETSP1473-20131121/37393_1 /ASSEMBLY_ACC=CAM_ASM_001109 /TAXON_ID=1461547 /ORGANISM="Stichococcus sp, Strain RCC1054" /LENGTH=421 /DNA_ID=CAMNT_0053546133 /DNA_START=87 /DNA_END=1352 /DNA_ORIENTATION=+